MNNKQVIEKLQVRQEQLEALLKTYHPRQNDTCDGKLSDVKNYLSEVKGLINSVDCINKEIFIVTMHTLDAKAKKADFAAVEEEGYFFRLISIRNFPYDDIYLLYLKPLTAL